MPKRLANIEIPVSNLESARRRLTQAMMAVGNPIRVTTTQPDIGAPCRIELALSRPTLWRQLESSSQLTSTIADLLETDASSSAGWRWRRAARRRRSVEQLGSMLGEKFLVNFTLVKDQNGVDMKRKLTPTYTGPSTTAFFSECWSQQGPVL